MDHSKGRGLPSISNMLRDISTAMPNTPLKLLDVVALLVDKSKERLVTGQVGTVVEVLSPDVYEVVEATISASLARDLRADENDGVMKTVREKNNEMLRDYDFSQGVRGKYARRYARGSNVVVLDPDVAKVFPNAEAVNSSLRSLAAIIRRRKSRASK